MLNECTSCKGPTRNAKIALIAAGICIFAVLLEISMRFGGFLLVSMQEYRNRRSIQQKGACRIMCLGESTTEGQYPRFLEEILNGRDIGVRFSVIDKGRAATSTTTLLNLLEHQLDEYRPDIVITMMGINDAGKHMPRETAASSKLAAHLKTFRIYKLARLLWLHIRTKTKEKGPAVSRGSNIPDRGVLARAAASGPGNDDLCVTLGWARCAQARSSQAEQLFKKALEINGRNDDACAALGLLYCDEHKLSQARDMLDRAVALNPYNAQAHIGFGKLYGNQGDYASAEESFNRAKKLNPLDGDVHVELGKIYRCQGKLALAEESFMRAKDISPQNADIYIELGRLHFDQGRPGDAEDCFGKAIELDRDNDIAYAELGWLYRDQREPERAEAAFRKSLDANPNNDNAYFGLGWLYRDQGMSPQTEMFFEKAIALDPRNDCACLELGFVYREQGRFKQAEEALKKARALNPWDERVHIALAGVFEEMGERALAQECMLEVHRLRRGYYLPITVANYRRLKDILDRRGIRLVCVQYPMRSAGPLKRIFDGKAEGIIFVDNEKRFKDMVDRSGYGAYFRDMFAGDFGHCTETGNRLLAANIADTILKEIFHK
ncbi:MAG: tetratricopeptide repeat protein [Candidatus Omnitrophica bacterium]|nr:tetratricopeptide repeat protein [Candidatus Omnitrophota bacterium]